MNNSLAGRWTVSERGEQGGGRGEEGGRAIQRERERERERGGTDCYHPRGKAGWLAKALRRARHLHENSARIWRNVPSLLPAFAPCLVSTDRDRARGRETRLHGCTYKHRPLEPITTNGTSLASLLRKLHPPYLRDVLLHFPFPPSPLSLPLSFSSLPPSLDISAASINEPLTHSGSRYTAREMIVDLRGKSFLQ